MTVRIVLVRRPDSALFEVAAAVNKAPDSRPRHNIGMALQDAITDEVIAIVHAELPDGAPSLAGTPDAIDFDELDLDWLARLSILTAIEDQFKVEIFPDFAPTTVRGILAELPTVGDVVTLLQRLTGREESDDDTGAAEEAHDAGSLAEQLAAALNS